MAQGNGVGTSSQRRERGKRAVEQRAVRFDNPIDHRHMSTPQQRARDHKSDERCRASPQVADSSTNTEERHGYSMVSVR
jgi:hypothetical protein